MYREVFEKEDTEKMPEYGHSKAFALLPHYSEHINHMSPNSSGVPN